MGFTYSRCIQEPLQVRDAFCDVKEDFYKPQTKGTANHCALFANNEDILKDKCLSQKRLNCLSQSACLDLPTHMIDNIPGLHQKETLPSSKQSRHNSFKGMGEATKS